MEPLGVRQLPLHWEFIGGAGIGASPHLSLRSVRFLTILRPSAACPDPPLAFARGARSDIPAGLPGLPNLSTLTSVLEVPSRTAGGSVSMERYYHRF